MPREWHLRMDPLLLVATLGLVACSLIALNGATQNDIPGEPHYYVTRQAIYAGVGLVLMYGVSRIDYSRLRELRYPIYGVLLVSIALGAGDRARPRAAPRRGSRCRASTSSHPSSARCCWS